MTEKKAIDDIILEHTEKLNEHERTLTEHDGKINKISRQMNDLSKEVSELRTLAQNTHEKMIEGNAQVLESNKYLREQNQNMSQTMGQMATQLLGIKQDSQTRRDALRELNANNFWKIAGGAVTGTAAGGGILYFLLNNLLQ